MLNRYFRQIRAIVVIVSLSVVVISAVQQVDTFVDAGEQIEGLQMRHEQWQVTQARNDQFERSREQLDAYLRSMRPRMTTVTNVASVRDRLIDHVRAAACRVSRLQLSPTFQRAWAEAGDDVNRATMPGHADESNYELQTFHLDLRIHGGFQNVVGFLKRLADDRLLLVTELVTFTPADGHGQMDLVIQANVYGLVPRPEPTDDEINL